MVDSALRRDNESSGHGIYRQTVFGEIAFGILASMIVAYFRASANTLPMPARPS